MQLNSVPKDSYGVFYKGDVYLIYHSVESSQPKVFSQHIHLWIGSDSSQVSYKLLFKKLNFFETFYNYKG